MTYSPHSVVSVKSSRKDLLQTEGTVILHVTSALKEDPELRKVFIKSIKVHQHACIHNMHAFTTCMYVLTTWLPYVRM